MKRDSKIQTLKNFSVNSLDKETLKSSGLTGLRTSFAIEGIKFSDSKFRSMTQGAHLKK